MSTDVQDALIRKLHHEKEDFTIHLRLVITRMHALHHVLQTQTGVDQEEPPAYAFKMNNDGN